MNSSSIFCCCCFFLPVSQYSCVFYFILFCLWFCCLSPLNISKVAFYCNLRSQLAFSFVLLVNVCILNVPIWFFDEFEPITADFVWNIQTAIHTRVEIKRLQLIVLGESRSTWGKLMQGTYKQTNIYVPVVEKLVFA